VYRLQHTGNYRHHSDTQHSVLLVQYGDASCRHRAVLYYWQECNCPSIVQACDDLPAAVCPSCMQEPSGRSVWATRTANDGNEEDHSAHAPWYLSSVASQCAVHSATILFYLVYTQQHDSTLLLSARRTKHCNENFEFWARSQNWEKRLLAFVRLSEWSNSAPHWTDFHRIWYLSINRKSVDTIPVSLQSANNNRYFTCRPIYIFYHISLSSSQNEKCFRQKLYRKSKHTFCVQ